jgi:hypothetical protein
MRQDFFMHNGLHKLANRPDSLNTAPADFSLFGKAENTWIGTSIQDKHELFLDLREILSAFPTTEFRDVLATGSTGWNKLLTPMMRMYHQ